MLAIVQVCAGRLVVVGLFLAGYAKGRISGLTSWRSGLEMALLGAIAAGVTYAVGTWIDLSTT